MRRSVCSLSLHGCGARPLRGLFARTLDRKVDMEMDSAVIADNPKVSLNE